MAAHYEQADLLRQATLLAVGISQAQAFLDGNKRTAFAACDVFLRLNGLVFSGDPVEMAKQLETIASRPDDLAEATTRFEHWLRERVAEQ
jgi:death-on-curing protein